MVVALDLESEAMATSEIHDSGVLARTNQDSRALCGKTTEQWSGVAVTAVL
jgi:hypothetical protein